MKNDNSLEEDIIAETGSVFKLKPADPGEFKSFGYPKLLKLFKFNTEQYKAEGLGNIAILKGSSLLGLSILTAVITPERGVDLPLLIIDYVAVKDKITVFVEFFGHFMKDQEQLNELAKLCNDKSSQYNMLENYSEKENWYTPLRSSFSPLKKGSSTERKNMKAMILDYLSIYLQAAAKIENNGEENAQLQEFIDDLIIKGNPSSSILKKALGARKANEFFRSVIVNY